MRSLDFRTAMLDRVRAFDNWVWRDYLENPSQQLDQSFDEWFELLKTFMETQSEVV